MKKTVLFSFLVFLFQAYALQANNDDILEELEFYLKGENKKNIKEKNKSSFRENLHISQKQIDEIIDNRRKLSGDDNDLKILENNIKINDSSDLNFIHDNKDSVANENILVEERQITYDDMKNAQINTISSPILRFITKTVRPFLETRIDNMLMKMGIQNEIKKNLDLSSRLKIHTLKEGVKDSKTVTCGRNVEISLDVEDEYGNKVRTDYDNQRFWLVVGHNNFTRGVELGLIGSKIGESREVIAPPEMNLGTSSFAQHLMHNVKQATFRITVHDMAEDEEMDKIQENLLYYDTVSSFARKLSCGDFVNLDLKLLNAKGEILYEKPKDRDLLLILGSNMSKYLEQILIGSYIGGKRVALSNTENLETLKRIPALFGAEKIINEYSGLVLELSPKLGLKK